MWGIVNKGLLTGLVVLTVATTVSGDRSLFGESCNKTHKCDSGAWLGCFEGTCDCIKQNEMLYDEITSKCVSKAGERCKYAVDNPEICGDCNLIYEVTPCVQNATCSQEGICTCDSRFHENVTGLCTFSQGNGDFCDMELKCSYFEALECINGLCQCNSSTSEYSSKDSQCVGLADSACINFQCTPHAYCQNNTCRCNKGFYVDEEKKCHPKVGPLMNCTANNQCESKPGLELFCIDGVCDCNPNISLYATAQVADRYRFDPDIFNGFIGPGITQCVGLAGSPCLDRLCVPRAYCSYSFATDFSGICKCMSGYKQTKLGRCGHDFLETCDSGDSCLDGLVCNDKKCTCKYSNQEYDTYGRVCYSKIGGPCNRTIPCGTKAECQFFPNVESAGHCQCREGYVENLDGFCEVDYEGSCDSTSDCDSIASLECINSICQCGSFSDYSKENRKCVGLIGAKCNTTEEKECIENAYCAQVHAKLPGVCKCNYWNNFTETYDYRCDKI